MANRISEEIRRESLIGSEIPTNTVVHAPEVLSPLFLSLFLIFSLLRYTCFSSAILSSLDGMSQDVMRPLIWRSTAASTSLPYGCLIATASSG